MISSEMRRRRRRRPPRKCFGQVLFSHKMFGNNGQGDDGGIIILCLLLQRSRARFSIFTRRAISIPGNPFSSSIVRQHADNKEINDINCCLFLSPLYPVSTIKAVDWKVNHNAYATDESKEENWRLLKMRSRSPNVRRGSSRRSEGGGVRHPRKKQHWKMRKFIATFDATFTMTHSRSFWNCAVRKSQKILSCFNANYFNGSRKDNLPHSSDIVVLQVRQTQRPASPNQLMIIWHLKLERRTIGVWHALTLVAGNAVWRNPAPLNNFWPKFFLPSFLFFETLTGGGRVFTF